jgi:hypothetical protein
MTRIAGVFVVALLTPPIAASQPPDAARVLADMRAALGGEAIDAVKGFSVEGDEERTFGDFKTHSNMEWVCVLPDRFIVVRNNKSSFARIVDTNGFNGDRLVRLLDLPASLASRRPPAPPQTPEQYVEGLRTSVTSAKRQFSRYAIALLGITSAYPLDATYAGRETIDTKAAHVLLLKAADDYEARLYVDVATHLPLMISWMGRPDVAFGNTSVQVIVMARQPPVERRIYFSDYKTAARLTWPHRFKEVVAGVVSVDIRLSKFKINPKVDPARFVPVPDGG